MILYTCFCNNKAILGNEVMGTLNSAVSQRFALLFLSFIHTMLVQALGLQACISV